MLAEEKKRTNIGVGLGISALVAGRLLSSAAEESGAWTELGGMALFAVGAGLFLWGTFSYARGKGYHWAWGLLGLLSVFGLLILVALDDKHPERRTRRAAPLTAQLPPPPPPRS